MPEIQYTPTLQSKKAVSNTSKKKTNQGKSNLSQQNTK